MSRLDAYDIFYWYSSPNKRTVTCICTKCNNCQNEKLNSFFISYFVQCKKCASFFIVKQLRRE